MKAKWVIPDRFAKPTNDRLYWERTHAEGYGDTVFSVSSDPSLLDRIASLLPDTLEASDEILVAGCGTNLDLPRFLQERYKSQIVCCDFPGVIEQIAPLVRNEMTLRSADLRKESPGDDLAACVAINAIVGRDDLGNRAMLKSIGQSLRPGGAFVGLFPTILFELDLASVDARDVPLFDHRHNLSYEAEQDEWQICYTPFRLRRVLAEAGLALERMELFFFDDVSHQSQAKDHYDLEDSDTPVYELLVKAFKRETLQESER